MDFATDLETFADTTGKVQNRLERSLLGPARYALRRFGREKWYDTLADRAVAMMRARYRAVSGNRTSAHLRSEADAFRTEVVTALKKTKAPTKATLEAQARAIAASLSTGAVNAAHQAAGHDDPETELEQVWVSMEDNRVRPTHAAANGQAVPLGETFTVGDSKMRRPGDTRAPIEEWINCRCLVAVRKTAPTSIAAAVAPLEDTEHPTGGDMAVKTGPAVDVIDQIEQASPPDVMPEEVPWHGVLVVEDAMSGDGRKFSQDALRWRDLPLPLAYQKVNQPGHDGSVIVGRIDEITREGSLIWGSGMMLSTPEAGEAVDMLASRALRGVSIDADDGTMQMELRDGRAVDEVDPEDLSMEDIVTNFTSARICGATLCAIPAFQEAYVSLGLRDQPVDEQVTAAVEGEDVTEFRDVSTDQRKGMAKKGQALPDGSFPIATVDDLKNAISAIGRAKDPAKAKAHIKKRANALGHPELIPDGWAEDTEEFAPEDDALAAAAFVKTEDGPGWLTHPVDTERLRKYWVHGKGAIEKIHWGIPGDFKRCETALAKYVKPQYLAGYCANRHYDALGFWPGRPTSADTEVWAGELAAPALSLVASATPDKPPMEWFEDPHLTGPSAIVVTEEGRVFGHAAQWGTCHIGISGVCTEPPQSETDYAYFRTGYVLTDNGPVATGPLTMGTGHASLRDSARQAAAHYDNTGAAVADVAVGEDEHGIWVAGWMRPGTTPEQWAAMRGSALSGDWREIADHPLEAVAFLAVNTPGFSVPRTALAASGGHQTALVAAGIVHPKVVHTEASIEEIVDRVLVRQEQIAAAARIKAAAKQVGRDPATRMKALAASRGSN